jgi:hypothetical protein
LVVVVVKEVVAGPLVLVIGAGAIWIIAECFL